MRVLSIDFDFFQIVDSDTIIRYYPDGHDFSTDLSIMIWGQHYAHKTESKIIKSVKTDKKLLSQMISIIENNADYDDSYCHSMIVNSHRHIYDFISNNFDKSKYNGLDIYNVDMHHDMFDTEVIKSYKNNKEITTYKTHDVDCGNWASCLMRDFKNTTINWIKNPISDMTYSTKVPHNAFDDFTPIKDMKFDLIFLCRSDIYLPPHLDKDFDKLRKTIQSNFATTMVEESILKPRNIKPYVEQLEKAFIELDNHLTQEAKKCVQS